MGGWLKNRFGRTVAIGALAVAGVGGLAYAFAGPLSSSNAAATSGSTANFQATGTTGSSTCTAAPAGAGASTGTAAASSPSSSGCTALGKRGVLRKLLARTAHASLTIQDKSGQWVTVDLDRGTVQSISSTSITILRPDGVTVTAPLDSSTKFLRQAESSVVVGDRVVVVQEGGAARYVIVGKAAGAKAGKTGHKSKADVSVSVS
jgi:hypothetical protein